MNKRLNPADLTAQPNEIVRVNRIILVAEPRGQSHMTEHTSYSGKPKNIHTVLRSYVADEIGQGMYVGHEGKVTAFIWLDNDLQQ